MLTVGFEGSPQALVMEKVVADGPLRLLLMSAGGGLTSAMLGALLLLVNGHFFKGLAALWRAYRKR